MTLIADPAKFRFDPALTEGFRGKRVLITGSGKAGGLGQAFALTAALAGAHSVGVHFYRSYEDGLATCELINEQGGNAFPVQADVTSTSDVWASRTYVINRMAGEPPDIVICNSGLSESGYVLGRPPKPVEGESSALRRARARQSFVDNLNDSRQVLDTKMLGFLYMTHLWAGEALHFKKPLKIIYISSRQAIDPGAGVPGYVLANFGVLALPTLLAKNLGRKKEIITAFSIAYPFVHTGMTTDYVDNAKVFGRWQPRMLETHEAALALSELIGRPDYELDGHTFQLNVAKKNDRVLASWSRVALKPVEASLDWSTSKPLDLGDYNNDSQG